MKTPSCFPNGPQIEHRTSNTGDVQAFALTAENFEPEVVGLSGRMDTEPAGGYRLGDVYRSPDGLYVTFEVQRESDRAILTLNTARLRCRRPASIALETRIVGWMPAAESMLVADLEQCAAIGLLFPNFPDLS